MRRRRLRSDRTPCVRPDAAPERGFAASDRASVMPAASDGEGARAPECAESIRPVSEMP
jgi:hypothetical protein